MSNQAYLIALRQRAYLQAVLLSQQLVLNEDGEPAWPNKPSASSKPNIAYLYDEHVRRWWFCQQQRKGINYTYDFNAHAREYHNWKLTQHWEKKQHAQLHAWDRSFEDLAEDFYPDEALGRIFTVIEPAIAVSERISALTIYRD